MHAPVEPRQIFQSGANHRQHVIDLEVALNGETMQGESTKDMIFGVARLVSYVSQGAQLLPGALVLTGSPAVRPSRLRFPSPYAWKDSGMTRIVVDFDRCEGHGLCEQTAPEVFRLDDEGELHLTRDEVDAEHESVVAAAVRVCPVAALKVQP